MDLNCPLANRPENGLLHSPALQIRERVKVGKDILVSHVHYAIDERMVVLRHFVLGLFSLRFVWWNVRGGILPRRKISAQHASAWQYLGPGIQMIRGCEAPRRRGNLLESWGLLRNVGASPLNPRNDVNALCVLDTPMGVGLPEHTREGLRDPGISEAFGLRGFTLWAHALDCRGGPS
jgi:hypothetical protein